MAQQSSFYNTDGSTRTYPSSKHIASKQHVAVYFKSVSTSTWAFIEQTLYDLVNNSIVFTDAPDNVLYSEIEIRVADTAAELTDSPSDIATVAGSIANVNTVAGAITSVETVSANIASVSTVSGAIVNVNAVGGSIANVNTVATSITSVNTVATNITDVVSVADTIVPNIAEILLADTNAATATTQAGIATTKAGEASTSATNAQLRAWEAEAERLTADSYATEAEDVFVKVYTSNGDGTFTATNTAEYSALHWRNKAALIAVGQASNISVTPTGNIASTNVQNALAELDSEKAIDANVVHNTLNESINGIKTFISSPIVPTPTANFQAATKKYVDDKPLSGSITGVTLSNSASAGATTWDWYEEATATLTATGMTTSPTGTARFTRNGDVVTIEFPSYINGTSNATTFTLTGVPANFRPSAIRHCIAVTQDVGAISFARARIEINGTITLFKDAAGNAFTASGTKGCYLNTASYHI